MECWTRSPETTLVGWGQGACHAWESRKEPMRWRGAAPFTPPFPTKATLLPTPILCWAPSAPCLECHKLRRAQHQRRYSQANPSLDGQGNATHVGARGVGRRRGRVHCPAARWRRGREGTRRAPRQRCGLWGRHDAPGTSCGAGWLGGGAGDKGGGEEEGGNGLGSAPVGDGVVRVGGDVGWVGWVARKPQGAGVWGGSCGAVLGGKPRALT